MSRRMAIVCGGMAGFARWFWIVLLAGWAWLMWIAGSGIEAGPYTLIIYSAVGVGLIGLVQGCLAARSRPVHPWKPGLIGAAAGFSLGCAGFYAYSGLLDAIQTAKNPRYPYTGDPAFLLTADAAIIATVFGATWALVGGDVADRIAAWWRAYSRSTTSAGNIRNTRSTAGTRG